VTASVIKILTENGRVRYDTVRYGVVDKFGAPTVIRISRDMSESKLDYLIFNWVKIIKERKTKYPESN